MRNLFLAFLLASSTAFAGDSGDFTDTPDVVARMVHGLATSKIDQLTSKTYEDGRYSYHLKAIDYLGTVQRDGRRYTVAAARFIRSSSKGSEYPPARGHGFLIIFDDAFKIATHGRMGFGEYHMNGHVLMSGQEVMADFGTTEPAIRYHGWMLDGSDIMPYPFADGISEADWDSGAFLKKP